MNMKNVQRVTIGHETEKARLGDLILSLFTDTWINGRWCQYYCRNMTL